MSSRLLKCRWQDCIILSECTRSSIAFEQEERAMDQPPDSGVQTEVVNEVAPTNSGEEQEAASRSHDDGTG
jgi:hypothetical protein